MCCWTVCFISILRQQLESVQFRHLTNSFLIRYCSNCLSYVLLKIHGADLTYAMQVIEVILSPGKKSPFLEQATHLPWLFRLRPGNQKWMYRARAWDGLFKDKVTNLLQGRTRVYCFVYLEKIHMYMCFLET